MPVKGTKSLEAGKLTTVISTYTTELPVFPASDHLSIYVDLAAEDQHREVEVRERLKDLINRAREEDYRRPSSGTSYYYMPIAGARSSILFTTTSTLVVEGMVAIGIAGDVRGGGKGSIILDACWKEITDWLAENDRLTV